MSNEPRLIQVPEAAAYLGISVSTLNKMRMAGRNDGPPYVKLNKSVYYRRADLDRWVVSRLSRVSQDHL